MLHKVKNRKQEGFTIIEVLIVLAIAGLILLIVFLAVPALQRSSRNTQRKNDAAGIGGAVANFISNNNGSLPVGLGKDVNSATTIEDFCSAGGSATIGGTTACGAGNLETTKLGYYAATDIKLESVASGGSIAYSSAAAYAAGSTVSTGTAVVALKGTCDSATAGKVLYDARSAAIVYVTESGSGFGSIQCVEQ